MDATLLRTENHFLGMPIRLLKIDAIRFISWRKKMKREKVIFSFQVSLYRVLPYYVGWIYIRSFGCRANQDFLCLHKSAQEDNTRTPPSAKKIHKTYSRFLATFCQKYIDLYMPNKALPFISALPVNGPEYFTNLHLEEGPFDSLRALNHSKGWCLKRF